MDKRFLLAIWLSSLVWLLWIGFQEKPKPPKPEPQPAAKLDLTDDDETPENVEGKEEAAPEKKEPPVELVAQIELGTPEQGPDAEYFFQAHLTNRGAAVTDLYLNNYKNEDRKERLHLLKEQTPDKPSYLMTVVGDDSLATKNWKVEDSGPDKVRFHTTARGGAVEVVKEYALNPGDKMATLRLEFKNTTDQPIKDFHYRLAGGNGLPVEGEWYTRYFRDAVFMRGSSLEVASASDIASRHESQKPQIEFTKPVQYAGVTDQYFASLVVQPDPKLEDNYFAHMGPVFLSQQGKRPELSNIGVEMRSVSFELAPGETVSHELLLYNGPKDRAILNQYAEYGLPNAIHYSGVLIVPGWLIAWISYVIVGLLYFLHSVVHDYGLAIILMTIIVRICLYPLTFRQTHSMMKMQAIQPEMQRIKEQYANDRERQQRAMSELLQKHQVNPLGGCLPILVQLPIFMGLWQALSNSFALRQANFLFGYTWIKDLSAPDKLFAWPFQINIVDEWLGPYFNLLPLLAVAQMIISMRIMAPPPTTPEAKMQQQIMTVMMVMFSFLFYKVPSGLCLYIIMSGLWSIMERKLMPRPKVDGVPANPGAAVATANATPADTSWKKPVDRKKLAKR